MKKLCVVTINFNDPSGKEHELSLQNFTGIPVVTSEKCRFIRSAIVAPAFAEEAAERAAKLMQRHEASVHAGDEPVIKNLPQEEPIDDAARESLDSRAKTDAIFQQFIYSEECPEPTVEEGQHVGVVPDEEETDLGRPPGQWSVEESLEKLREHSRAICDQATEDRKAGVEIVDHKPDAFDRLMVEIIQLREEVGSNSAAVRWLKSELVIANQRRMKLAQEVDKRFGNCVDMRLKLTDHIDKLIDGIRQAVL